MSRITPAPDGLISRLQPYIDGELDPEARAAVEAELAEDPDLQDMVREQIEVREAIRGLDRPSAPSPLRARLLLELDAIDREEAEAAVEEAPPPPIPLARRRWRDLLRGGLVMAPAAAAAIALFAITRLSTPTPEAAEASSTPAQASVLEDMSLDSIQPKLVGAGDPGAVAGVSLVSLGDLDPAGEAPLRELREHQLAPGVRILELRESTRRPLPGARHRFHGREYLIGRDRSGRALVAFEDAGVTHVLVRAEAPRPGDQSLLLDLADRLRSAPRGVR